jgi:hypothetical protein
MCRKLKEERHQLMPANPLKYRNTVVVGKDSSTSAKEVQFRNISLDSDHVWHLSISIHVCVRLKRIAVCIEM